MQHGIAKGSALILGLPHHHDGDDLVITSGWSAMLEAFGFSFEGEQPLQIVDASVMFEQQISRLKKAAEILAKEHSRKEELEKKAIDTKNRRRNQCQTARENHCSDRRNWASGCCKHT